MSTIDQQLAETDQHIADIQRQAHELRDAAKARPSLVAAEDLMLMERLLAAWQMHRVSISSHPELRERGLDEALKRSTRRDDEI